MEKQTINIMHVYPDLLNLYGDNGNIECMRKRLEWRGFGANVIKLINEQEDMDVDMADIIFIGGGSDREQEIVAGKLAGHKKELKNYVEKGGVLLAVCGGFQLLGKYYKSGNAVIQGLEILDIITESGETRLIGNIVIKNDWIGRPIVGFENHAGRTYIDEHMPFGEVVVGNGNNGDTGNEGVLYKNVIATYLHGPLLPKNPQLCDYILLKAIQNKYPDVEGLTKLDDRLEHKANYEILNRFCKKLKRVSKKEREIYE